MVMKIFGKKDKRQEFQDKKQKRHSASIDTVSRSPSRLGNLFGGGSSSSSRDRDSKKLEKDEEFERYDPKKMPPAAEVNKRFERVLKYRGIVGNDKRKKAMMTKPLDDKWKLVLLHEKAMEEQNGRHGIREKRRLSKSRKRYGVSPQTEKLKARLHGRKYVFQDQNINIYGAFQNEVHLDNLVAYWELIMQGEPIVVFSPSAEQCSNAVLSLVSLIAPIHCGVDYRPYFTVHNSDFKHFSSMGTTHGFQSVILGVTNPFFIKSLEKWPHIISIGVKDVDNSGTDSCSSGSRRGSGSSVGSGAGSISGSANRSYSPTGDLVSSMLMNYGTKLRRTMGFAKQAINEDRLNLMWEFREMFSTERLLSTKNLVIKQSEIAKLKKELITISDPADESRHSAEAVNNEQIRKFFENLTETFLQPLHRCFDTILCSAKTFIFRAEHQKMFKPEKFYHYVVRNGYPESIFHAHKAEILEFYKKFIFSANFKMWLEERVTSAYHNAILHTEITQFIRTENLTEVGYIDIFLRLRCELDEEIAGGGYFGGGDDMIIERLTGFLSDLRIAAGLPV